MTSQSPENSGSLLLLLTIAIVVSGSSAFQSAFPSMTASRSVAMKTNLMDPNSAANAMMENTQFQSLLSTLLLQPAQGHSNPLFGPPDPYLAAGKSIPPSAKALEEFGITPAKTAADFAPADASPEYIQSIQTAMDHGWKITNFDKMKPTGTILPGFSETHGILPDHQLDILPPNPMGFAAQVEWAYNFLPIMNKLPTAVCLYCFVEFFFLRPTIDFYKEEIEADPTGAAIDTAMVFGVRLIAIAIVSTLTAVIFG